MSLRDFELFSVDCIFIFEMDPMLVGPGQPQVIFVHADGILVLKKDVQVPILEFLRNLQVAPLENVISGKSSPGSVWNVTFDGSADFSRSLVREWVHLVFFHFHDAHDVVPFDGDFVQGTVLNVNLAVLVAVDADQ